MSKYCIYCGAALTEKSRFCPECGKPVERPADNQITNNMVMGDVGEQDNKKLFADEYRRRRIKHSHRIVLTIIIAFFAIIASFIAIAICFSKPNLGFVRESYFEEYESESVDDVIKRAMPDYRWDYEEDGSDDYIVVEGTAQINGLSTRVKIFFEVNGRSSLQFFKKDTYNIIKMKVGDAIITNESTIKNYISILVEGSNKQKSKII